MENVEQQKIHPVKYRKAVIPHKAELFNWARWIVQEKYNGIMTKAAQKDIARLEAGEPVDYIIGWVEFLECRIGLSKKPLVPRIETEFWVNEAISQLKDKPGRVRILDMFAGSGCIGIAVIKHIKNAEVTFADSQKNCVEQIKINCAANRIPKNKYTVIESDMFSKIEGKYDYIFANPPYIPLKNKNKVQKSALKHEPHQALFGGSDGLFFIRTFLAQAKNFLAPHGKVFMEFDTPQKKSIEKLLAKNKYARWEFHKDQFGKWRWVSIVY